VIVAAGFHREVDGGVAEVHAEVGAVVAHRTAQAVEHRVVDAHL